MLALLSWSYIFFLFRLPNNVTRFSLLHQHNFSLSCSSSVTSALRFLFSLNTRGPITPLSRPISHQFETPPAMTEVTSGITGLTGSLQTMLTGFGAKLQEWVDKIFPPEKREKFMKFIQQLASERPILAVSLPNPQKSLESYDLYKIS